MTEERRVDRKVLLVVILAVSLVTAGCNNAAGKKELTGTNDVAGDVVRTRLLAFCPAGLDELPPGQLLPAPARLYAMAEPVGLEHAELTAAGLTEGLDTELQRLADDRGLSLRDDGKGLGLVFHPAEEWPELVETCGLDVDSDEAYYLVTAGSPATEIHVFAPGDRGRFYALKTVRQLVSGEPPTVAPVTLLDYPGAALRGVVEGYYGQPWNKDDRLAMLEEIADLKMNTFVYAPKADGWINAAWMQPYPNDELLYIRQVVERAQSQRIRVCWELHIGWALSFSSEKDLDTMFAKFDSIGSQGVDCFVLAFDDVNKFMSEADSEVYAGYAEAQADFADRLGTRLLAKYPEALLAFVPVEYWTDHEDAATDLKYLGENLADYWYIAWTGRKIIPKTISVQDALDVAALLQRPPFLGDNYPVSDAGGGGEVYLGPLVGRAAGLATTTTGLVFNPMPLPFASLPALATAADYSWNGEAYDPARSTENAARLYGAAGSHQAVATLFRSNRSPILEDSMAPGLQAHATEFLDGWAGKDIESMEAARGSLHSGYLDHFAALDGAIAHPAMAAELVPWLEVLAGYGDAASQAMGLLLAAADGTVVSPEVLGELLDRVSELGISPYRPTGPVMTDFVEACVLELEAL